MWKAIEDARSSRFFSQTEQTDRLGEVQQEGDLAVFLLHRQRSFRAFGIQQCKAVVLERLGRQRDLHLPICLRQTARRFKRDA